MNVLLVVVFVYLADPSLQKLGDAQKIIKKNIRARFRSWDLWVMGPPRFHCATLIFVLD
jgi:hypothetical protein